MLVLIILLLLCFVGYYFEVSFDYLKEENLFLIFFTAKNRKRKCIKIKF